MSMFENKLYFSAINKKAKIKTKLNILFLLNITDLLCSWFFFYMYGDIFYEANPIGGLFVMNPPLAFTIKILLVYIIIKYWNLRLKKADDKGVIISNITANLCLILYSAVNVLHLFKFTLLLFYGN